MYPLLNLRNNVINVFKAPSASLSLSAVTTTLNFVNYVSPFYYSLAFLNITTYISIPKEYLFRVACFWMSYLCFHTLYSIFCDFFYSLVYLWDSHVDGWNCSSTMIDPKIHVLSLQFSTKEIFLMTHLITAVLIFWKHVCHLIGFKKFQSHLLVEPNMLLQYN